MNKKTLTITLIICVVLAVVLVSVIALTSGDKNAPVVDNNGISAQNQPEADSTQASAVALDSNQPDCVLILNDWQAQGDTLTVEAFAQAFLPGADQFEARMDFWKNNTVLESTPLTLNPGEGTDSYEAEVTAEFKIPEVGAEEELQVWLIVELGDADVVYSCAAGWYMEDGKLMLITG